MARSDIGVKTQKMLWDIKGYVNTTFMIEKFYFTLDDLILPWTSGEVVEEHGVKYSHAETEWTGRYPYVSCVLCVHIWTTYIKYAIFPIHKGMLRKTGEEG